jgi:hypothetical protein
MSALGQTRSSGYVRRMATYISRPDIATGDWDFRLAPIADIAECGHSRIVLQKEILSEDSQLWRYSKRGQTQSETDC